MSTTLKIRANQLKIGMYVAQLDRPWLETPFLFQGFYVRDQDEIRDLQAYCDYVYILREERRGDPDPGIGRHARVTGTASGKRLVGAGKRRFRLPAMFRHGANRKQEQVNERPPYTKPGMFYEETESFENELKSATSIHEDAVVTVHDVMSNLQTTDKLDLQRLEAAVTPMVNSILRNPAALSCLVRLQKRTTICITIPWRHWSGRRYWGVTSGSTTRT